LDAKNNAHTQNVTNPTAPTTSSALRAFDRRHGPCVSSTTYADGDGADGDGADGDGADGDVSTSAGDGVEESEFTTVDDMAGTRW
jgi:hypothetical protein